MNCACMRKGLRKNVAENGVCNSRTVSVLPVLYRNLLLLLLAFCESKGRQFIFSIGNYCFVFCNYSVSLQVQNTKMY